MRIPQQTSSRHSPLHFQVSQTLLKQLIFSFADLFTLSKIGRSCRQINYFVEHSSLWQILCNKLYPHITKNDTKTHWKQVFKDERSLEHNLRHGVYAAKELKTIHGESVNSYLIDFDSDIIVAANFTTIYFWTLDSDIAYLELHESVLDIKLCNEFLLTATENGLILRNKYAGSTIETLSTLHFVTCAISENYIAGTFFTLFRLVMWRKINQPWNSYIWDVYVPIGAYNSSGGGVSIT